MGSTLGRLLFMVFNKLTCYENHYWLCLMNFPIQSLHGHVVTSRDFTCRNEKCTATQKEISPSLIRGRAVGLPEKNTQKQLIKETRQAGLQCRDVQHFASSGCISLLLLERMGHGYRGKERGEKRRKCALSLMGGFIVSRHLVSVRTLSVMYDRIFSKLANH